MNSLYKWVGVLRAKIIAIPKKIKKQSKKKGIHKREKTREINQNVSK